MNKYTSENSNTNGSENLKRVGIIGGGPAGLVAAAKAASLGAAVTIFEANHKCGRKLRITGKGRCNITNDCSIEEFLSNVPRNPRFLYAALNNFSPEDTKAYFEGLGVQIKTERGKRVFPVSDDATEIVDALVNQARDLGCEIIFDKVVAVDVEEDGTKVVETITDTYYFDSLIIATGGKSYPLTGSTGDGYKFARSLGHSVTKLSPSLVPMVENGDLCNRLMGVSLRNINFSIVNRKNGKTVFSDFGEMLFTHYGMSGPVVLSSSAHIQDIEEGKYYASIDLKPALSAEVLDKRILSDFDKYKNKNFDNSLNDLLPSKMISVFVDQSGIDRYKKVNEITKEERKNLVALFKDFRIDLLGFRPIEEAIITSGGIPVKEITPSTMESKIVSGLYFAGEIIDVDAYTGGFNLQIAYSTGILAGEHSAY